VLEEEEEEEEEEGFHADVTFCNLVDACFLQI
jgi:hypothetical protein